MTDTKIRPTADRATGEATTMRHWIGGRHDEHVAARLADVHDPATGRVVARVPMAGPTTVNRAVDAARIAARGWGDSSLAHRARVMFAFRELLNARREELAACITREHGKVREDALGEVARGIEVVEYACGIPHLLKGEHSERVSTGIDAWSIRQPLGVVAGITPFNFPAMVPLWMFPIAIAAGNAFVLKPSEKAPGPSDMLAGMLAEAGLPAGVFNVVHGDAEAVDRLLVHRDIAAISSVSSTPVAKHVYRIATEHGKRVQALGGAKNHMVVLPDADMELAADAVVGAAFGSAGQRCMAVSVLVAVGSAGDELVPRIVERMAALTTGPGTDGSSQMGPVITAEARERIAGYVADGVDDGAHLVVDGRSVQVDGHEGGYWIGPTLFDQVRPGMSIYADEIFGPVLCVVRAASWSDAMRLVNESPYANGAALFTNDGGAARRFQREVQVGMVGINVPIPVPMAYYSFGGWKGSLFGDTHMHGMDGVRFFTRMKAVTGRWPDPSQRGVDLGFPTT